MEYYHTMFDANALIVPILYAVLQYQSPVKKWYGTL